MPYCRVPMPYCRVTMPYCRVPMPYRRVPMPYCRVPMPYCSPNTILQSPNAILQSPNAILQSPNATLQSPNTILQRIQKCEKCQKTTIEVKQRIIKSGARICRISGIELPVHAFLLPISLIIRKLGPTSVKRTTQILIPWHIEVFSNEMDCVICNEQNFKI